MTDEVWERLQAVSDRRDWDGVLKACAFSSHSRQVSAFQLWLSVRGLSGFEAGDSLGESEVLKGIHDLLVTNLSIHSIGQNGRPCAFGTLCVLSPDIYDCAAT